MEKEFLHKISVPKVLEETGLDIRGLSELIDVDPQSVYRWSWDKAKSGNRPKFNALIKMLEKGATVETLFGVEYKAMHKEYEVHSSTTDIFNSPEFQEGMLKAINDLKAKGLIK